jgi:hypothetical protein
VSEMTTRTDDQFDNTFVEKLLLEYYSTQDEQKKKYCRNTIIECLIPVVSSITRRWNDYDLEDLFQGAILDLMENVIPKWTPKSGNIGGYFRKSVSNYCYTVTGRENKQSGVKTWGDEIPENESEYIDCLNFDNPFEGILEREIYREALHCFLLGETSIDLVRKRIGSKYGASVRKIGNIVTHAYITIKEEYANKVASKCEYNISDNTKIFNRLVTYIQDGDLDNIIKIFGGLTITIPKGKYNGRNKPRSKKA